MATIILVIHLLLAISMIGVVLIQKSEGGGLGMGGGGGMSGFMTGRSTHNLLTRTTAILAAGFFATSIALALLAGTQRAPHSIIEQQTQPATPNAPAQNAPAQSTPAQGTPAPGTAAPGAPAEPAAPSVPLTK